MRVLEGVSTRPPDWPRREEAGDNLSSNPAFLPTEAAVDAGSELRRYPDGILKDLLNFFSDSVSTRSSGRGVDDDGSSETLSQSPR